MRPRTQSGWDRGVRGAFLVALSFAAGVELSLAGSAERRQIASALFGIAEAQIDINPGGANYDYNPWGSSPNGTGACNGYDGGHSGVDMQTMSVAGALTAEEPFYAVSEGEVIAAGAGSLNTIAVYDSANDLTVLYLHARSVGVSVSDQIAVGTFLGIQGDSGSPGAEHVHIEVREGQHTSAACGAAHTLDPEVVLLAYLEGGGGGPSTQLNIGLSGNFPVNTLETTGTTEAESNVFAMDGRDRGNAGTDGSLGFGLNTVSGALDSLAITGGPGAVAPGGSGFYQCTATFAGGSSLDVSALALWQVVGGGPAGVAFVGNELRVGGGTGSGTVNIRATYAFPSGVRASPEVAVAIQPGLYVAISEGSAPAGTVSLSAAAGGGAAPYQYAWDLEEDGVFDDAFGSGAGFSPGAGSGGWRVGVRVTDAALATATAYRVGAAENPLAENQPEYSEPRYDVGDGTLVSGDGAPFQFVTDRTENGLIVIVHGLRQDETAAWMGQMAGAIEERLGSGTPNIALFGWGHYARDPGELPQSGLELLRATTSVATAFALAPGVVGYADEAAVGADFAIDAIYVRKIGLTIGQTLANWIALEARGATPNIDTSKPIHLIGHSAGGFVVGECARILEGLGIPVDRITLLDTPFADISHIGAGSSHYPNLGHADHVISSYYGFLGSPTSMLLTTGLGGHSYYHRHVLNSALSPSTAFDPNESGHGRAVSWYIEETIDEAMPAGFYLSPFVAGPMIPRGGGMAPLAGNSSMEEPAGEGGSEEGAITGFETFGNASLAGETWTFVEGTDAGIWKELNIPLEAASLNLGFQFTVPGDGDFLAVRFGDGSDLYYGKDLVISQEQLIEVEIPLDGLQTQSGKLTLTLVSRGSANATLAVSDVRFGITDDTDADGLLNDDEAAMGSDPLKSDSDGDSLGDGFEVATVGTSPALADSDGDGNGDGVEWTAGTAPLDAGSFFRVVDFAASGGGGFTLHWPGVAGKSYRIHRSAEPARLNYDTIVSGLPGLAGPMSFMASPPGGWTRAFYWIEVE